jgi:uncharacterized protein (TIGR00290 family)
MFSKIFGHSMIPTVFNWSGGKDSALALASIIHDEAYEVRCLLTTLSEEHHRISMHGVREALLDRQSASIGIPLFKIYLPSSLSMDAYAQRMEAALLTLKDQGIQSGIFGDIFLEDLRTYRETALAKLGWKALFPLWKRNSKDLVQDFIARGFKAILVAVDASKLDKSFAGRLIDQSLLDDLPPGVDPCGENGEFHSFVFDGPFFKFPVNFHKGEVVHRSYPHDDYPDSGFYFLDLLPPECTSTGNQTTQI